MSKPTILEAFCRVAEANQVAADVGLLDMRDTNVNLSLADMTGLVSDIRALQERCRDHGRIAQELREELQAVKLRAACAVVGDDGFHPADIKPPVPGIYHTKLPPYTGFPGFSHWRGDSWSVEWTSYERASLQSAVCSYETAIQEKRWKPL